MTTTTETATDVITTTTTVVEETTVDTVVDNGKISYDDFIKLLMSRLKAIFNGGTALPKYIKKSRQTLESDIHGIFIGMLESEEGLPVRPEKPLFVEADKEATYEVLFQQYLVLTCGENSQLLELTKKCFELSLMWIKSLRETMTWDEFEFYVGCTIGQFIVSPSRLIPANIDLVYSLGKEKVLELVAGSKTATPVDEVADDVVETTIERPELDLDTIDVEEKDPEKLQESLKAIFNAGKAVEFLQNSFAVNFELYWMVAEKGEGLFDLPKEFTTHQDFSFAEMWQNKELKANIQM